MADGTEYDLPSVTIRPGDITTISVNDALSQAPEAIRSHLSEYGSAALRFFAPAMIVADLQSLNVPESLDFNYSFGESQPDSPAAHTLEALWWKHDSGVGGFLVLMNSTDRPRDVRLSVVGSEGAVLPGQEITIMEHATRRFDLNALLNDLPKEESLAGGIRIQYTGESADIRVAGGLENPKEGFSAQMPYFIHDPATSSSAMVNLASVGIMVGSQDAALGFPAATRFTPYLVERNTTDKPIDIAAAIYYMAGKESKIIQLPARKLGADQALRVPLENLLPSLGLGDFNGSITLKISYNGQPGDLAIATGSVDQSGTYVSEVAPERTERSWGKDIPFWSVANGNDTMLSLWNTADKPEDVLATFSWNGSSERYLVPIHLSPFESQMIDLVQLIESQKPDPAGNLIPKSAMEGSIQITSPNPLTEYIHIAASAGIFNVKTATCIMPCICCPQVTILVATPSTANTPIGTSTQMQITATWRSGTTSDVTSSATYSSQNIAVATVQTSGTQNPGMVAGVGVGSTALLVSVQTSRVSRSCYPYLSCPPQPVVVQTPVNVGPKISGISPSRGLIGSTISSATITGQGFTGGSVNTPAAILVHNLSIPDDKHITLDLEVTSNATKGKNAQAISVKASGQTSNAVDFFVQVPTSLSIVAGSAGGTTEKMCNSNTCGTIVSFKYQVNDQDSPAQPIQASMSFWDSFGGFSPDNLNLGNPPLITTCSPNQTNSGPCGVNTSTSGTFTEAALGACSTVCYVNGTCTTGGPSGVNQTWHVAGYSIVQQVSEYCQKVVINGAQIQ